MTKREQLERILSTLKAGKFTTEQLARLHLTGPDGKPIRINAPDAIAAVEKLIAALPPES